jgi:hypothetical protein
MEHWPDADRWGALLDSSCTFSGLGFVRDQAGSELVRQFDAEETAAFSSAAVSLLE